MKEGKNTDLTFEQVLAVIKQRRPCSPATLRRYLKHLEIRPLGEIRTKPQWYGADAPGKVLDALGSRLVTLAQLRSIRNRSCKVAA